MNGQIVLGILLVAATTIVHAVCTGLSLRTLRQIQADRWVFRSTLTEISLVAAVVVVLLVASLLEAGIWAGTYVLVGAIPSLEESLYFSTVTYTTLGFGDITLSERWRILSAIQAANGTMLFGWSTALIIAFIQRIFDLRASLRHGDEG